jgi:CRP-like cAMP-binding protein
MELFNYPSTIAEQQSPPEVTLLADLSKDEWGKLLNLVESRRFHDGEKLIEAGDEDGSIYILIKGAVDVVAERDGSEIVLATVSEGSVFGEIAFFDGSPRSASVRARSDGSAVKISREKVEELAMWEPKIARKLLFDLGSILAVRLRWTTRQAY